MEELLNVEKSTGKKDIAVEYLQKLLSAEDLPSTYIYEKMKEYGIAKRTVQEAKKIAEIKAYKKGKNCTGIWKWGTAYERTGKTCCKPGRTERKIRARYKGVDRSELEFIPAKQKEKLFEDAGTKRVCAYCRVSTDDANQTSSYELQKNHYEDMIKEHAGWTLVGIYADEGISGTSLQHRDEFNRMIEDCKAGKIDLIVTKSVSRFARNIVDCIAKVRELANMKPQVGVFFETEHIYTLDNTSEMMLAV